MRGINNSGTVVGAAQNPSSDIYFQYSAGLFTTLATYPLGTSIAAGVPVGINSAGQTVGPFSGIAIPGAFITVPEGINDPGDIAGWYQLQAQQGFLDIGGTFYAVDAAGLDTLPFGLNNQGDIVGSVYGASGCSNTCGFLLTDATPTPTPEPSSIALLATPLLGILWLGFRSSAPSKETPAGDTDCTL